MNNYDRLALIAIICIAAGIFLYQKNKGKGDKTPEFLWGKILGVVGCEALICIYAGDSRTTNDDKPR
jgi:ABC-type Mn2+/Zn2+ transport system permease subunit